MGFDKGFKTSESLSEVVLANSAAFSFEEVIIELSSAVNAGKEL